MARKTTTKSRIIDAAWQLFHEKGYDETTIEDIIARSETSKGTFYHYFEGKDSLLSSLSNVFDSYYVDLYPSLNPEMNSVDKLITLCIQAHQMIYQQIQLNLLSYLNSSQVITKGDKHLLDQNRYYYKMVRQIAEDGFRRGEIRSDLSVTEIVQLYSMAERAIIYDYCISNGSYDLGQYTEKMIPILLEGIRA